MRLLALLSALAGAGQEPAHVVEPRTVPLETARKHFDPAYLLPAAPEDGPDLRRRAERLVAMPLEVAVPDGSAARSFADLVLAARAVPADALPAWWARVAPRLPAEPAWLAPAVGELLLDARLRDGWDPDEPDERDGLWEGDGWRLPDEQRARGPWRDVGGGVHLEQAATLLLADLATIQAVESDYAAYPGHVGADYEWIRPLERKHLRGVDERGRPFTSIGLEFRCDLPFPFGGYTCRLHVWKTLDERGRFVTDLYSTSGDFRYMVGRDVFLPLDTSAGRRVGYLLVRDFGFDLSGVPDRAGHRRAALRSSLGNLRRGVDARWSAGGGGTVRDREGELPAFEVRGPER